MNLSVCCFVLKEFRKNHDAELLNTVAAQELKLVSYSKRLTYLFNLLNFTSISFCKPASWIEESLLLLLLLGHVATVASDSGLLLHTE